VDLGRAASARDADGLRSSAPLPPPAEPWAFTQPSRVALSRRSSRLRSTPRGCGSTDRDGSTDSSGSRPSKGRTRRVRIPPAPVSTRQIRDDAMVRLFFAWVGVVCLLLSLDHPVSLIHDPHAGGDQSVGPWTESVATSSRTLLATALKLFAVALAHSNLLLPTMRFGPHTMLVHPGWTTAGHRQRVDTLGQMQGCRRGPRWQSRFLYEIPTLRRSKPKKQGFARAFSSGVMERSTADRRSVIGHLGTLLVIAART
jgi:hypothetical protein